MPQDRSKIEQIVLEFFAKCLHIILESRIPSVSSEGEFSSAASSSSSEPKTRDKWFNLALGDCTAALQNFEPWRRNLSDPMVIDITLQQSRPLDRSPSSSSFRPGSSDQHWAKAKGTDEGPNDTDDRIVLERWTVHFEQQKKGSSTTPPSFTVFSKGESHTKIGGSGSVDEWSEVRPQRPAEHAAKGGGSGMLPTHVAEVPAVYKRTVIMLRSLYSRCRLLPAYRLFRLSNSPSNCCNFTLNYRVLSSPTPLSEYEDRDMSIYSFTPVETLYGRMCLSVAYRLTTSVISLEVVPSILPRIIPDYVGSPTTDPLKRFTGEPHSLPSIGMPIHRGIRMVSVPPSLQNSPPGLVLGRRHSWSGRINQLQPSLAPPSSPSYRTNLHPEAFITHRPTSQPICISSRISPPFSPSPSPSPPTHPGSAPVSIPKGLQSRGIKLDPHQRSSRNLLPPLSPSSRKPGALLRSASGSPRHPTQFLPSVSQSRSSESYVQEDPSQQFWKSDGNQPENVVTGSRTPSKSTFGDDGEDDDFSCPFAVDDVDIEEKVTSAPRTPEAKAQSFESTTLGDLQQVSQDAAVGALIRMLRSAQPLRHSSCVGFASTRRSPRNPRSGRMTIGSFLPTVKTMADALEELKLYKDTRDVLDAQGRSTSK